MTRPFENLDITGSVTTEAGQQLENQMQGKAKTSMMAILGWMGVLVATSAAAQSPTNATPLDTTTLHHQREYQMMKYMNQEMSAMTEQMSRGELTVEQRKQMAQRMAGMSTMMRHMSGLEGRPAMSEAEWQRQMDQMGKQMNDMIRDASTKPPSQ